MVIFAIWDNRKKNYFYQEIDLVKNHFTIINQTTHYILDQSQNLLKVRQNSFQINKNKIYNQLYNGYKSIYSDNESYFNKIFSVKPGTSIIYDAKLNSKN